MSRITEIMKPRLPAILKELAGVIGREAMIDFAHAFGGTRVYIPAQIQGDHPIARAIGDSAAKKLADHFASTSFTKTNKRITRRGLTVEIALAPDRQPLLHCGEGLSVRAAALKYGVTERTIQRRRARAREMEAC